MGFGYACNRKMAAAAALRMLLLPVLVDVLFLYAQIWTLSPKRGGACQANYSTHTCAGVDVNHRANHDQHLQDGTCLFENVCIFNGELTYTVHPGISDAGSVRVPRLHALSRLWRANPREPFPIWEEVKWHTRQGYIPPHVARTDVVHVYIRRIFPRNAGHVLGDDAWAIFQAMLMFDILDYSDIQVIVDDDDGPALGADFWSNKIFALVSGRRVIGMRDMAEQHSSLCFGRFLTGWGGSGLWQREQCEDGESRAKCMGKGIHAAPMARVRLETPAWFLAWRGRVVFTPREDGARVCGVRRRSRRVSQGEPDHQGLHVRRQQIRHRRSAAVRRGPGGFVAGGAGGESGGARGVVGANGPERST